jgi:TonB family protein
MKPFFTLLVLFTSINCLAQKQNVFFLKNNGSSVQLKDSADFIRTITEPEAGSELFNVTDVYKSGKKKLVGKSINSNLPTRFDGQTVEYFENGERLAVTNYNSGRPVDEKSEYFPNGKLYIEKTHTKPPKNRAQERPFLITANYDSLGTALVTNGNGYYKGFDANFKQMLEEGPIKKGLRDGEWKGREDTVTFVEKYKAGELIEGVATFKSGITQAYKNARESLPEFRGGAMEFLQFLGNNIRYPATDRERNIQGRVTVSFDVDLDGNIKNIAIVSAPTLAMGEETVRVIKLSPKWIPAKKFGLNVSYKYYIVPVNYTLGN